MTDEMKKMLDEWPNGEDHVLDNMMRVAMNVESGEDTEWFAAAHGISGDLLALDYYMRNGRIPTAWRK